MKFERGTMVQFTCPNGEKAKVLAYERDGFYRLRIGIGVVPGHEVVAHEDDLQLDDDALIARFDITRCRKEFDEAVAFAKVNGKWTGNMGLHANLVRLSNIAGPKKAILM